MDGYRAIVGAVAAGTLRPQERIRQAPLPFVTISRQAGAGGNTLKERLVQRLEAIDKADPPWTGFDRELVEKVADDYHLSSPLLETLDEADHSDLSELMSSFRLYGKPEPSELAVYRRVAKTIRALARIGRVVIVGRGAMFITEDLPAGIHIYLVAPLKDRIEMTRRTRGLARDAAADWVTRLDKNRHAFYRRHWPQHPVGPEVFTVTFNTARIGEDQIIDAVLPLMPGMQTKDEQHKLRISSVHR